MLKKSLLTLLALLGGVVFLLGVALWFRDPLARFGANRVLASSQITITALRGLEFDTHHLALAELGVTLPSGQALSLSDIDLRFILQSLRGLPLLQSLAIATAQLSGDVPTAPAAATQTDAGALSVNALLAQPRAFSLPSVTVDALVIPQWHEAMRLALQPDATGLNLDVASGALHLLAQFSQQDAAAPAQLQASLTRLDAVLGELQVTLAPGPDTHMLDGSGRLVFDDLAALVGELQEASSALPALQVPPLHSADLSWRLSGNVADDLFGTLTNGAATSFVFGLSAGSTFSMPEGVIASIGASTVTFPGDMTLTVTTGAGMGISTGQVPLRLTSRYAQEPVSVDGTLAFANCFMSATPCNVDFRGTAAYGSYAANGELALTLPSLTAGPGAYHITSTDLVLSGLPPDLPAFDVDAALTLENGVLSFTTPLVLHGAPKPAVIAASGDYTFATGAVHARLTSSRLAFTQASPLSSWLREWPYAFDLLTGSVDALAADARWQSGGALAMTVKGTLRDIGGAYETYVFSGLNGPLEAEMRFGAPFTLVTPPLSLKLAALDVGLPLTNLALDFQIDRSTQTFIASAFRAEVLGGTLSGDDLRYAWSAPRNEITLRFAALDVAAMVTLVGYEGVEASGRLSGTIPLTLGPGSVVVTGGELHAEEPGGVIRYLSGVGNPNTGNAQLDLVNQILSDFQFHALSSAIDYSPDGELTLSMQLQGHNPDLGSNQPINLNLNLSNNIPALMKSLNAARNIEDFLREQLNTVPQ